MSLSSRPGPQADLHGLIGQVVDGRFRVLGLQHAGPRGFVYEVEPPSVGYTRRALKVVTLADGRDPIAREALQVFVAAVRGVEHPDLARVIDMGLLFDESPYLLTEWCPLPSLEALLEAGGPLPHDVALDVLARTAEAAGALHARGLCHADVRPAHVLIDADEHGVRTLKLIDAGIMAALDAPPAGGATGTVAFEAPERIAGRAPTASSDVYALGVLGYLLLTGHLPYRADDERAEGAGLDPVARVRWLHLNESPVRPSRLGAEVPPAVEAVIGRALSKDPSRRHANASAFAAALEVARRVPARDPWPASRVCVPTGPPVPIAAPTPIPERMPTPEPAIISYGCEVLPPRPRAPALWPWVAAGAATGCLAGMLVL